MGGQLKFIGCVTVEDRVYFVPYFATGIMWLNMLTKEIGSLSLPPKMEKVQAKFGGAATMGNYLYLMPRCVESFVVVDTRSLEVSHYDIPSEANVTKGYWWNGCTRDESGTRLLCSPAFGTNVGEVA